MRFAALTALTILGLTAMACGGDEEAQEQASPTMTATTEVTSSPTAAPTSTPSPTPRATISPTGDVLAFGSGGSLFLINADGSGGGQGLTNHCDGRSVWSPSGDRIACASSPLIVYDMGGTELRRWDGLGDSYIYWSPDNRRIAYKATDGSLHVVDVEDAQEVTAYPNGLLLEWLDSDTLLVGLDVDTSQEFIPSYSAYALNLANGEMRREPFFDDGRRFWMFPDRTRIVTPEVPWVVRDLATGVETPLPGFMAGNVSEMIPYYFVAVSGDGTEVYGAWGAGPTVIYRAQTDGSGTQVAGTVAGPELAFSPQGRVAWIRRGGDPIGLTISDFEAGTELVLGGGGSMVWRPLRRDPQ